MKIFDAHFHIIDFSYEVKENNGYIPPSYLTEDYQEETQDMNIAGGAIVSGSFQGFDQQYLLQALSDLGSDFCSVTQLPYSVSDEEIVSLNDKGVRALRFNVKRGGSEDLAHLSDFAKRVHDLVGWHSELYIDSKNLPDIEETILSLPAVSIDHLGLSKEGLPNLLRLVDKGVHVKATGFSRVDLIVQDALKEIYHANPDALMFGTDLPSTRAPKRFTSEDIQLVQDTFGDAAAHKIFYQNAKEWYRK
ncbi:amidohydrolase family protein [Mammaliicoccus sciuri]|uniref:amidohydrolase family protein n=1 Tax=Mammaliicoccus sciuri TaxID=1296 RepID=UPI000D1DE4B9|nr:amidohydrolase family protein [Mammaliicoccus sciuri]MEB6226880.1 amidohydrolase family protein [Mammaliicoccus sciuri]PTK11260.1 2-pyrone-4,6-dicarboxylate hydrolase [Mammaliicoccus sciuri]